MGEKKLVGRLFISGKGTTEYILSISGSLFFRVPNKEFPKLMMNEWISEKGLLVRFRERPPSRPNNKYRYACDIEIVRVEKPKAVSLSKLLED